MVVILYAIPLQIQYRLSKEKVKQAVESFRIFSVQLGCCIDSYCTDEYYTDEYCTDAYIVGLTLQINT